MTEQSLDDIIHPRTRALTSEILVQAVTGVDTTNEGVMALCLALAFIIDTMTKDNRREAALQHVVELITVLVRAKEPVQ